MTQVFAEDGRVVPVTIIDVAGVTIAGHKTMDKDGYEATVLAKDTSKNSSKSFVAKYKQAGFTPLHIVEAKNTVFDGVEIGGNIKPDVFELNEKVHVVGTTKGKGFQGVVKRWGFHGGSKTHGQSDRERHPGSIGSGTTPGRVLKGKKMGGRMGGDTKTIKNLRVVFIDVEQGLIGIKGAVPGNKGSLVIIKSYQ